MWRSRSGDDPDREKNVTATVRFIKRMGECIMPREGVFAIVLHGGTIRKGDLLERIE